MKMDTARWIIKLNFLILGLCLAFYAMFVIKHRGINPNVLNSIGISASVTSSGK